jgi:glucokinase
MTDACLLIGDIGGTNARFALADNGAPGYSNELVLKCADFESATLAIEHYLQSINASSPDAICLAAAGPIVDQRVRFTNNDWNIAAVELAREFSIEAVQLLNDFEAIAYSVPLLSDGDCLPVGLPEAKALGDRDYTVAVMGPGTGLGAVGLCSRNGASIPIASEASHGGFAPESQVQIDMLAVLRERFDRVSDERLVSGPGLENIYWALTRIHGEQRQHLSAADIFAKNADGSDPRAAESVQMFFEILGQICGDFALALGAHDGLFIAGGIVQRYPELVENSRFRSGFENKGRYRSLMERIPTQLILHPHPGLLGASHCALLLARTFHECRLLEMKTTVE